MISVAALVLVAAPRPAGAQLGHIARGVDKVVDAAEDLFTAVQRILESLSTRLPEIVANAPAAYVTRLQHQLEAASWYTIASWDRYVSSYYPQTYIDTWRARAEWQVRKAAATAEEMTRNAVISAGVSMQQPFTAAKLELMSALNKTPLGVLWSGMLGNEIGLHEAGALNDLSQLAVMDHQRDMEDRLERNYRQMQALALHAERNGGLVPDTAVGRWSTVTVGQSVQSASPPMVDIPVGAAP